MHAELAAALQSTANKLLQATPGGQGLRPQQLEVRQVEEGRRRQQRQQDQAPKLCACVATDLPELAG